MQGALNAHIRSTAYAVLSNEHATFEDIKQARIGHTQLTFTAASVAALSLDAGKLIDSPARLMMDKLSRFIEKVMSEATTTEEATKYMVVPIARFYMTQDIQEHLDVKGMFDVESF